MNTPCMVRRGERNGVEATLVTSNTRLGYLTEGYGTVQVEEDGVSEWYKFICVLRSRGNALSWRVEGIGITDAVRRKVGKVLWHINYHGELYQVSKKED